MDQQKLMTKQGLFIIVENSSLVIRYRFFN